MLIDHFNESLVVVALLFLVLPCGAASTSETNSASARDGASVHQCVSASVTQKPTTDAPTNDHRRTDVLTMPPVAGLQAAAVPLLPQAVPLSSVKSLLDLARHSACREAAQAIEQGNIAGGLAMLDKLASGAFHWRGAVTNGYQQGFFVYALRGYCLERLGDIVKAYRAYQNGRAYFDDTAVAMQCPEPRLEVFLGLGRTCLVAGRYTDAFNWLDLVRLEASADPRIAAAADRGLIRRAVEIGDYHDAITNYWDLQFQLAESEESQHGDHSHIAQAEKSNSKFVRRERIYTPEEYREFAQIYFWRHQDRPGFKTLLDGITLLGIDNELGMTDPLVVSFQDNILRADDAEISRFYDVLGYAISQARMRKGDEEYIASLCGTRLLMGKVFDYLLVSDDLRAATKRCEQVKHELAASQPPVSNRYTTRPAPGQGSAARQAERPIEPRRLDDSAVAPEDEMMKVDCLMRQGQPAKAMTILNSISIPGMNKAEQTTQSDKLLGYDGAPLDVVVSLGKSMLAHGNGNCTNPSQAVTRGTLFGDITCLRYAAYVLTVASCGRGCYDVCAEDALAAVPPAHPCALRYLAHGIGQKLQQGEWENAAGGLAELERRWGSLPVGLYATWARIRAAQDETSEAFGILLRGLQHYTLNPENGCHARDMLADLCANTWAWADDVQLEEYLRTCRATLTVVDLHSAYREVSRMMQLLTVVLPAEQQLRAAMQRDDWSASHGLLSSRLRGSAQAGHTLQRAIVYAALGNTNAALAAVADAYAARLRFYSGLGTNITVALGRAEALRQEWSHNLAPTNQ
ncbi:MAG: hypothetical protein NTV22_14435 [bacterium]|nr:hypothetical protein [bacterium]